MDHVLAGTRARSPQGHRPGSQPLWVYLESRGGLDRWLHIDCPCGCGDLVSLNLLEGQRPRWWLAWGRDGTLSVTPAVWKGWGCGTCFSIETGEVSWAGGTRRPIQPPSGLPAERLRLRPRADDGAGCRSHR